MKRIILLTFFISLWIDGKAQTFDWIQTIRPGGNEYCWDVATDPQGNILTTGRVKAFSYFGTGPFIQQPPAKSLYETDVFVAKYRHNGDLVWAKRDGGVQADWGRAITCDLESNVWVTGDYCDTAYYGNKKIIGAGTATNRNLFIAKYDSSGVCLWAKTAGNAGDYSRGYGIITDKNGNGYLTGHIAGVCNFDGITFGTAGANLGFIAKLKPDGTCIWAKSFYAQYGSEGDDIKLDKDGNILLTGAYRGTFYLGTSVYPGNSPSWPDVFVAKLDPDGNVLWSGTAIGAFRDIPTAISSDANGDVYVLGSFANDLTFGKAPATTTINSVGTRPTAAEANMLADIFLAKYSAKGDFQWVKTIGNAATGMPDPNDAWADVLMVTNSNKVMISGFAYGKVNMNGIQIDFDTTYHNTFIAAMDGNGKNLWYKTIAGGTNNLILHGLASDAQSNFYFGGEFTGNPGAFDSLRVESQAGFDGFIAKMTPPLEPVVKADRVNICPTNVVTFSVKQDGSPLSYRWTFPGGIPATSTLPNPAVTYNNPGKYNVTVSIGNNHQVDTLVFSNYIYVDPASLHINLGADAIICKGQTVTLDPGAGYKSYLWNDGSAKQTLAVDSTGNYFVNVTDADGCRGRDSIQLTFIVCTDIASNSNNVEVSIGPNPAKSFVNLHLSGLDLQTPVMFELFNSLGQQEGVTVAIEKENTLLDLSGYAPGIYSYSVLQNKKRIKSGKLMLLSK